MEKQSLEAKIRYQVACEEKAHRLVIQLLEPEITEEDLVDAVWLKNGGKNSYSSSYMTWLYVYLHLCLTYDQCYIWVDFCFLQGLYITPEHYQDITEERGISKLCGYPVCRNQIKKVHYPLDVLTICFVFYIRFIFN